LISALWDGIETWSEVRLKLGEHAEHVQEALAGGRAGIDRLLCRLERRPLFGSGRIGTGVMSESNSPGCDWLPRGNISDLRGTAVTRLALANGTVPEICAITGHSHAEANAILEAHYLHRDPQIAWNAIRKLEAFTASISQTDSQTAVPVPGTRTRKHQWNQLTGADGFEPPLTESESHLIPFESMTWV
jgi:hypothetical protein